MNKYSTINCFLLACLILLLACNRRMTYNYSSFDTHPISLSTNFISNINYKSYYLNIELYNEMNPDSIYEIELYLRKYELVDEKLYKFRNLKAIEIRFQVNDISDSQLDSIFNQLDNFPNIEKLTLGIYLNLCTIPDNIKKLSKLKELDLSRNNFKYLPNSISELHDLKKINFSYNHEIDLDSICYCLRHNNIEELDFIDCNIPNIPNSLYMLKSLRILDLSENKIKFVSKEFELLENIYWVNLRNNNLDTFMFDASKNKLLWYLGIKHNNFHYCPFPLDYYLFYKYGNALYEYKDNPCYDECIMKGYK
jgi:Leucine-rich repeat (LRR) protein